jgi:hypothetical protein
MRNPAITDHAPMWAHVLAHINASVSMRRAEGGASIHFCAAPHFGHFGRRVEIIPMHLGHSIIDMAVHYLFESPAAGNKKRPPV